MFSEGWVLWDKESIMLNVLASVSLPSLRGYYAFLLGHLGGTAGRICVRFFPALFLVGFGICG